MMDTCNSVRTVVDFISLPYWYNTFFLQNWLYILSKLLPAFCFRIKIKHGEKDDFKDLDEPFSNTSPLNV